MFSSTRSSSYSRHRRTGRTCADQQQSAFSATNVPSQTNDQSTRDTTYAKQHENPEQVNPEVGPEHANPERELGRAGTNGTIELYYRGKRDKHIVQAQRTILSRLFLKEGMKFNLLVLKENEV